MSLPPEIVKKVKLLDISTRKLVNNLFAGEYHTAFKGQGMAFAEFREYVPGDDVRSISWTQFAKQGKPFIKRYEEERELTLMLAVDVSGSTLFGSGKYLKGEIAAFIAALLGFSALKNNDRVGLLLFSNEVEKFVPAKKGRAHVQRILSEILHHNPKGTGTNIAMALENLSGVLRKKATVFVISDFMDQGFDRALRLVSRKHDTVAIVVQDPVEKELPMFGLVNLEDAETGEVLTVDASDPLFRRALKEKIAENGKARDQMLRRAAVDRVDILNSEEFMDPLIAFFKGRHRR